MACPEDTLLFEGGFPDRALAKLGSSNSGLAEQPALTTARTRVLESFRQENIQAAWATNVTPEAVRLLYDDVACLRRHVLDLVESGRGDGGNRTVRNSDMLLDAVARQSSAASDDKEDTALPVSIFHVGRGRTRVEDVQRDFDGDATEGDHAVQNRGRYLEAPKSEAPWSAPSPRPEAPWSARTVQFETDFLNHALGSESDSKPLFKVGSSSASRLVDGNWKYRASKLMEHPLWQVTFMVLTFYALFASDMDTLWGNKSSEPVITSVSTAAFLLFALEFALQSYAKKRYLCKPLFWLDVVALISMLPDTWFVKGFTGSSAFVAARSTKITRILRVASRSTRATRMNRLTRLVRVTTLVPRVAQTWGYKKRSGDIRKRVQKKVQQLFDVLDDDGDGCITKEQHMSCVQRLKPGMPRLARGSTDFAESEAPFGFVTNSHTINPFVTEMSSPRTTSGISLRPTSTTVSSMPTSMGSMSTSRPAPQSTSTEDLMNFEEFKDALLADEVVRAKIFQKCELQASKCENMQRVAARQSEDLGIKVALGVLLMLFVQTFVQPAIDNNADLLGLQQLQAHATLRLNSFEGLIPDSFRSHAAVFAAGPLGSEAAKREVLYLDVVYRAVSGIPADGGMLFPPKPSAEGFWIPRRPMADIDQAIVNSNRRARDIQVIRLPQSVEYSSSMDDQMLNRTVTSMVIFDVRRQEEDTAVTSLLTISLVIVLIFAGIMVLTQDMTYISRRLLKPLRNLSDEMQDIAKLKLAALNSPDEAEDKDGLEYRIAEIETLSRTFKSMKRAIKSWGKYVPWPVVKILLRAGQHELGVQESEVTIFFSDIASFTTIVEALDPKATLLLLSRYFHDMSKIIDANSGIVIEFIGDAILAVYGQPMENPDHATAGVKATLKMLQDLKLLNSWSACKGLPELKIRCGVHTGSVTIGNMGFHSRLKYGIVGEQASIPSRLEELNKEYGTDNLISQSTFDQLQAGAFVVRPIDFVQVQRPEVAGPEIVYQALARNGTHMGTRMKPLALTYSKAMLQYRKGSFKKAAANFTKANQLMQEVMGVPDAASEVMLKRCQAYTQTPPPPSWDGEFNG